MHDFQKEPINQSPNNLMLVNQTVEEEFDLDKLDDDYDFDFKDYENNQDSDSDGIETGSGFKEADSDVDHLIGDEEENGVYNK